MSYAAKLGRSWSVSGLLLVPALSALALGACSGDKLRHMIGQTCEDSTDCAVGICGGGVCLDPAGDNDGDQLTNEFELTLGTNPVNADTDNDGADDNDELSDLNLVDIDGDGIPDALESKTSDEDGDCLPDQYDPENAKPNDDLTGLIPIVCRTVGVCTDISHLHVLCDHDAKSASCDYGDVTGFEANETSCDGLDNDCDGVTDDGATDTDQDGTADCVDNDDDDDGIADADDLCPAIADANQLDSDLDEIGDACDPPHPPVVGGIAPASPNHDTTPTLTGLADKNAVVVAFEDGECTTEVARTTADASGQFILDVTVVAEGPHRHFLRAENAASLRSACLPSGLAYVLDTVAPSAPVFAKATPASPSTDPSPFIEGTAEAGALVTLTQGIHTFTATADGAGKWATSVQLDAPGDWPFSGTATDPAGNASTPVALFAYALRSDAPAAPYVSGPPFAPPSPSNTADPEVAISVCAAAGTTVAFWADGCGATKLGEVETTTDIPCNTGTGFVVTLSDIVVARNTSTALFVQSLGVGELTSACVPLGNYVHDSVAPAAPGLVTADPSGPFATGLAHMLLTVPTDANVQFFASAGCTGDVLATAWTGPNATLDVRFAAPKNQTTHTYGKATDDAGNTSACASLATFVHDDHAPVAPTPHVPAFIPTSPSSQSQHPLVTWCQGGTDTCVVSVQDQLLSLPIPGTAPRQDVSCASGFASSATVDVPANSTTGFVVTCATAAGVTSPSVFVGSFVHDNVPPAAPTLVSSDPLSPSSLRSVRLVVTAEAGAALVLTADSGCQGLPLASATAGGDAHATLAFDAPAQTTTSFYARATDASGNTSGCVKLLTFVHDDRVPLPPLALAAPWTPTPPAGTTTTPTLRACVQPSLTTEVFTGLGCSGAALALTSSADQACQSGASATTPITVTRNATTRVFGQTVGPTGVRSACVLLGEYVHDDVAPGNPVLTTLDPASPSPVRTPALSGTAEAGATLALSFVNTCAATAASQVVDRTGHWSVPVTVPADAQTSIFGQVKDAAGNASGCVSLASYTNDTIAPTAPYLPQTIGSPSSDPTPTIPGCAESGVRVDLYLNKDCTGVPAGSDLADTSDANCASVDRRFVTDVAVPNNATTSVWAQATDAANNHSNCIRVGEYRHDDIPPQAPVGFEERWSTDTATDVTFDARATGEPLSTVRIKHYVAATPTCAGATPLIDTTTDDTGTAKVTFTVPSTTTVQVFAEPIDAAGNHGPCAGPYTVVGNITVRTETSTSTHTAAPNQKIMIQTPRGDLKTTTTMAANGGNNVTFLGYDSFQVTTAWIQTYSFYDRNQVGPNSYLTYQVYQLQTYTTARPGDVVVLAHPVLVDDEQHNFLTYLGVTIVPFDANNAGSESYYVFLPNCRQETYAWGQFEGNATTSLPIQDDFSCYDVVGQNYQTPVWVVVRPNSYGQGTVAKATAYAHGVASWPIVGCGQGQNCGSITLGDATHPWSTAWLNSTLTITDSNPSFFAVTASFDHYRETATENMDFQYDRFGGGGGDGPFGSGPRILVNPTESAPLEFQFIPGVGTGNRVFVGKGAAVAGNDGPQSFSMFVHQRLGDPAANDQVDVGTLLPMVFLSDEPDVTDVDRPAYSVTAFGPRALESADFFASYFTWADTTRSEMLEWRFIGRAREIGTFKLPALDANPCPNTAETCNPPLDGLPNNRFKPSFYGGSSGNGGMSWFDMEPVPGSAQPGAAMNGFNDAWAFFGADLYQMMLFMDNSGIDDVLPSDFTARLTAIGGGGGGGGGTKTRSAP